MLWILIITGALLGGLMLEIPGLLGGGLLGYLLANAQLQSQRIKRLERQLAQLDTSADKPAQTDTAVTSTEPAPEQPAEHVSLLATYKNPADTQATFSTTPPSAQTPSAQTPSAPEQTAESPSTTVSLKAATDPWSGETLQQNVTPGSTTTDSALADDIQQPKPSRSDRPSDSNIFSKLQQLVVNYFTEGNLSIRIGIIVLFFGISFLIKYSIDNALLPVEVRLAAATAGAVIMLIIGWKLRLKRPDYGLVMQGGAVAILYLLSFASFKIYGLVDASLAFPLLILLSILGMSLAVIQDAKSLAVTAIAGGFAAPVLASTGSGNFVALFSYYSVLNLAIFAVAWRKSWRLLNVTGFYFTFVISALWGIDRYSPELFPQVEPFLIVFFLIYLAISVLFATRQPPALKGLIDGSLVFGLPLVTFSFQTAMLQEHSDIDNGLSLTALTMSGIYALLCKLLWHKTGLRILSEAFLAIAVVFATLALAFTLDNSWTAASWAIEGAGLIWIGLRQQRLTAIMFGILIQLAGGLLFLQDFLPVLLQNYHPATDNNEWLFLNGRFFSAGMLALSAVLSSWLLCRVDSQKLSQQARRLLATGLLSWGLLWWYAGGFIEIANSFDELRTALLFFSLSALLWLGACIAPRWQLFSFAPWLLMLPLLFCAMGTLLAYQWDSHFYHFFAGNLFDAWLLALCLLYVGLRIAELRNYRFFWPSGLHALSYLLASNIIAFEAYWILSDREAADAWQLSVPALILATGWWLTGRQQWPFTHWQTTYQTLVTAILGLLLGSWSVLFSFAQVHLPEPLPYLPILNPTDLTQLAIILCAISWYRRNETAASASVLLPERHTAYWLLGGVCFIWVNVMLCKALHVYSGIAYNPGALISSARVQMTFSICWTICGLSLMVIASRILKRQLWIAGAGLMALVVSKLFIFDLADQGTVERIVSFIVVGLLLLVVGYFSPAPPKSGNEQSQQKSAANNG